LLHLAINSYIISKMTQMAVEKLACYHVHSVLAFIKNR